MTTDETLNAEREKGLKGLLRLIEATHTLVSNGLFPGIASQNVAEVLVWLAKYHKDVKAQLPPEPVKVVDAVEPKVVA